MSSASQPPSIPTTTQVRYGASTCSNSSFSVLSEMMVVQLYWKQRLEWKVLKSAPSSRPSPNGFNISMQDRSILLNSPCLTR